MMCRLMDKSCYATNIMSLLELIKFDETMLYTFSLVWQGREYLKSGVQNKLS